jgi:hypothetical protein
MEAHACRPMEGGSDTLNVEMDPLSELEVKNKIQEERHLQVVGKEFNVSYQPTPYTCCRLVSFASRVCPRSIYKVSKFCEKLIEGTIETFITN